MEATFNVLELACELAHNRLIEEYGSEQSLYKECEFDNECLVYLDDVQDEFNSWYDYYFEIITNLISYKDEES